MFELLIFAALGYLIWKFKGNSLSKPEATLWENKPKSDEQAAVDMSYEPKVKMALVKPVNFKHNSRTWAKRMDFVITDKATKVLAVIELDDSTHNWKKRQERDQYVNQALEGHHKLVRFSTKRFYEPSEIAKVLERETEIKCNGFGEAFV